MPEGTQLWWRVPAAARNVRAPGLVVGAKSMLLPGRAGELRVSWQLPPRSSSFDGVAEALRAAYRERGQAPPA